MTIEWLLDSDPALKWQVQRDLLDEPEAVWRATRDLTSTEGFGARLLALQDEDGQWAGGAFFPSREVPRAITHEDDDQGQPFIATTWSLNALREWGVDAKSLGDTAEKLRVVCRWEYDDLPYWDGEVDVCINSYTLANGAWLGVDVSKLSEWFVEHQLEDGGWNCEWVEGSSKSSFHSTLNALIGLLNYEKIQGTEEKLTQVRKRGEEYLLQRRLLFKLSTNELVGEWATQFTYPARWRYSTLRAVNYFMDAARFEGTKPDPRLAEAVETIRSSANAKGRWKIDRREKGGVWFEVDSGLGEESKWVTFFALRALKTWDSLK